MAASSTAPVCKKTGKFDSTCNPFGKATVPHTVDDTCAITGDATSPGDKAQDKQKNNLCATGTPTVITIKDLTALQKDVDDTGVNYGNEHVHNGAGPPADRSTLFTKIPAGSPHEGDLVSFIGFIAEAKPGSVETVDCHCTAADAIDVHIALSDHDLNITPQTATAVKDPLLCANSFVAETIPHKRPLALELTAIDPLHTKKSIVKVTGQLLFDASHKPCVGGKAGSGDPSRVTVFEIHPVYDIEVCSGTTTAECTATSKNWKSVLNK